MLLIFFSSGTYAQRSNTFTHELAMKAQKMFSWKVKEMPPNGYMMFLELPYDLQNNPEDYISLTVARRYNSHRPAFISFTLPDHINSEKGLYIMFEPLSQNARNEFEFNDNVQSKIYKLNFKEHRRNNHTVTSRIWNGYYGANKASSTDVFAAFMQYQQLYILFYDSSGKRKLAMPLSFFQKQYNALPKPSKSPLLSYSTGTPADTALTKEEMTDKKIFDDNSIPTNWKTAGISDPIRLKHFIKYVRYLMNHNDKEKLAHFIIFPQNHVIPTCKDSADFVDHYDQIFDEDLKRVVNNQKLNQIFRNSHGVHIGHLPNLLIIEIAGNFKIYGIANNKMDKQIEQAAERYYKNR